MPFYVCLERHKAGIVVSSFLIPYPCTTIGQESIHHVALTSVNT